MITMKIKPYVVRLSDCYILGPTVSFEEGEVRIGLSFIKYEVGLAFDAGKFFSYGCTGCGRIGYAVLDELPPGWEKRYRPDHTYCFLCDKCRDKIEPNEDYIITDENREKAVDEIVGQFTDRENDAHVKAVRDYANKLLDESEPFSKYELSSSVAAFSDGYDAAQGSNQ